MGIKVGGIGVGVEEWEWRMNGAGEGGRGNKFMAIYICWNRYDPSNAGYHS